MSKMSYASFLWKSSNAHGIHSPFVYGFTEGLYQRQHNLANARVIPEGKPGKKALQVLFRVINYFKSYKLIAVGNGDIAITETIRTTGEAIDAQIWFYSTIVPVPGGIDLGILCGEDKQTLLSAFNELLPQVNNNSVIVLPNPHATAQLEASWEALKKDPNVTVSIDTYHLGLLFFRHGQAKQHFTIRVANSFLLNAILGIKNLWGLF
jgi:hypothetical protein